MAAVRHILTILAVDDVARAAAFYRAAFGWAPTVEVPVYVELEVDGGQRLGLYRREAFVRNTGEAVAGPPAHGTTATELYLHCDDLDGAIAAAEAAGARCLSARAPRDWGDDAAYYADPDGNVVVLAAPRAPADEPR